MLREILLATLVAMAAAGRSPNADLVEDFLKTHSGSRFSNNVLEDAFLDAPGLISKYGYPVEVHHTVTSDGYILEAHRIPHGRDRNNVAVRGKPVAFIMHGMTASSADFLVLGPGNALAYILAEEGYDVWLGNVRGNYYSRRHVTLDPDDKVTSEFWRFSWEQMGLYDIPAFVDYILATTGQERLHYIGHSQGGTVFVVLNSMRPEYNDKFISFQGLAPGVFFSHTRNPLFHFIGTNWKIIDTAAFRLGYPEIVPRSPLLTWLGVNLCHDQAVFQPLCAAALTNGLGFDENFNTTYIPVFLGHAPAGSSIRQAVHIGQAVQSNTFARFDYGPSANLRLYGSTSPPEFDLSRVTVPSYLHYGLGDREVDYRDILILAEKLGNTIGTYRVERESFNHFDYTWGGRVKEELFDRLVELLREAERR